MRRTGRRKADASAMSPPPPPSTHPIPAQTTPVPTGSARSPRFGLPLILAVSASILAVSAYQYGKHSAPSASATPPVRSPLGSTSSETDESAATASSLYPASRLPVLLSPASEAASFSPVLRHVAPFGLPALPYNSREGKYAYPLLVREGYVCQWNARTRNADWMMEVLNGSQPSSTPPPLTRSASSSAALLLDSAPPPAPTSAATRDLSTFRTDPLLSPASSPPTPALYLNSSYDRGHLVPAASAASSSQSAMDDTFYLTNVSPQHPNCNRGYWRAVESWLRATARRLHDAHGPSAALTVVTGPLWLEQGGKDGGSDGKEGGKRYVRYEVIPRLAPTVAVPTHFFKVVLATSEETSPLLAAFVVPNGPVSPALPLTSFVTSVAAIESSSGWHFFPLLARSTATANSTPRSRARATEQAANVIDVSELLLGASATAGETEGGAGRGLSELERASVFELCKDGGCDLSAQWKKIEQWDAFNHDKRKHKRRPTPVQVVPSTSEAEKAVDSAPAISPKGSSEQGTTV